MFHLAWEHLGIFQVKLKDVTEVGSRLTQIQVQTQQDSEGLGHHDDRVAKVGKIDHEQRQGSHGGKQELVPPPQIQHIISKAQEDHATDGQKSTNQLYKLIQQ